MKLSMRQLAYVLRDYGVRLLANRRDLWVVERTAPLSDLGRFADTAGTLFFCGETDPQYVTRMYSGINLLIFTDAGDSLRRADCPELNLMTAPAGGPRIALLSAAASALEPASPPPNLYQSIMESVISNTFREGALTETLTALAGNPIAIFDAAMRPVAATAHDYLLTTGSKTIDGVRVAAELAASGPAIFTAGGTRFAAAPISFEDVTLGYILMIERDIALDESDLEMLKTLSVGPAIEMQKGKYAYANDAVSEEAFLLRLVSGEAISPGYVDKLSLILGVSALVYCKSNYIAVLRAPIGSHENTSLKLRFLMQDAQGILKASMCAVKNDHLVLLFSGPEERPFTPEGERLFTSFLKSHNMLAGVSVGFPGLREVGMFYDQAVNAVMLFERLPLEDRSFIAIQDYLFFDLLLTISGRKRMENYISRKITLLRLYDRENGTDHLATLARLLENGCNIKQTAEKLFVHRNTLLYRVKKIEEISGLDLSDDEDVFNARMSLKILDFLSRPLRVEGKNAGTAAR